MSYHSAILTAIAATALAATAAQAQSNRDNDVLVDQIGTDNSAIISQSGQRNLAGSGAVPMLQNGIYNALTITQSGFGNTVGLIAPGLSQFGLLNTRNVFNTIEILQNSSDNVVGSVQQTAEGLVETNGANALSITQQTGDRNRVNVVHQTQASGQAAQRITIVQTGSDNLINRHGRSPCSGPTTGGSHCRALRRSPPSPTARSCKRATQSIRAFTATRS
jgi:hypothetical protein